MFAQAAYQEIDEDGSGSVTLGQVTHPVAHGGAIRTHVATFSHSPK